MITTLIDPSTVAAMEAEADTQAFAADLEDLVRIANQYLNSVDDNEAGAQQRSFNALSTVFNQMGVIYGTDLNR